MKQQEKSKSDLFVEQVFGVDCDKLNLHFKGTKDKAIWYRINQADRTMYVPGVNVLRVNQREVNRFLGAVESLLTFGLGAKEFDWDNLDLREYNTPGDIDKFLRHIEAIDYPCYIACDIETRDLSWDDNKLLSIGFATSSTECTALYNIPEELYSQLEKALNNPHIKYVWHNGKFDVTRLNYCCGIKARVDEDTEILHYVKISECKGSHKLKMLGPIYLQAPQWDDELDKYKKAWCRTHKVILEDFKYDMIPTEILIPYMQRDCIATYRLREVFEKLAEPGTDWIYRKLIEATNEFVTLELNGVMLDTEYVAKLENELQEELDAANKLLDEAVGHFWDAVQYAKDTGAKYIEAFNINSPKQLKWLLSLAVGKQLDSTDAATIEALIENADAYPKHTQDLLEGIARTRKADKYLKTYVVAMRQNMCKDGRVRGSYMLHGTETGRLSSKDPNMQNIPRNKKIKRIFKAAPGRKLVQLDYSQAELRVLGVLSGDDFLIQSYRDGKDLHSNVAQKIFGPNFTDEQRTQCKTINFGIAYGRGASAIGKAFHMTNQEAQKLINDWFAAMPKVKEYIASQRKAARRGERQQTMFGRVRHYVIDDGNMFHIENEYINTPIQSIASDLTLFSLIRISKWLEETGIDARIVMTVHDSIVLEVADNPELVQLVRSKCEAIMAETPQIYIKNCPLPFKADSDVGSAYGIWD